MAAEDPGFNGKFTRRPEFVCIYETGGAGKFSDRTEFTEFLIFKPNAIRKGIFMDCINGHSDHLHCLISLGSDQTVAKVVQLLKGESAFWINKNKLTDAYFEWQDEYFAISVSESVLPKVRTYIQNQEQYHLDLPFENEREQFLERYRFK